MVNLTDKFYDMNLNRTNVTGNGKDTEWEGHMLFISKVFANEYREAYRNCFALNMQFYADTKVRLRNFPTFEEWFLSFLFNMMENSYNIR